MGKPPFEDVSPIKNGGFPIAMLVYQRVGFHWKVSLKGGSFEVKGPKLYVQVLSMILQVSCGSRRGGNWGGILVGLLGNLRDFKGNHGRTTGRMCQEVRING